MRVALAQTDMVWEDKKASIQKAEKMVSEAAKSKADDHFRCDRRAQL